jgi:hypothetical protein
MYRTGIYDMTYEFSQPTYAEIRAFEAKAHELRAEVMQNGVKAIASAVVSISRRAVGAFSRPAHA